jgi:hypothetical protein
VSTAWLSEVDYPVLDTTFAVPLPPSRTAGTRHKDNVQRRRDTLASSLGTTRAAAVPADAKGPGGEEDLPLKLLTAALASLRSELSLPAVDEKGRAVDFFAAYRFLEEKAGSTKARDLFYKDVFIGDVFFVYGFSPEVRSGDVHPAVTQQLQRLFDVAVILRYDMICCVMLRCIMLSDRPQCSSCS